MKDGARFGASLPALASLPKEPHAAEKEKKMDPEQALKEIASYKYGQSRKSLIAVANIVRDSYEDPGRRKELRKRLTALLNSDTTTDCKRFVCRQLSIIGSGEEVPALGKLLSDEKLSDMSRFALERIPHPAAAAALRGALGEAKGKILVGIINSLGERSDREAAGALMKLMAEPDEVVAGAAAAALGKIGAPKAVRALSKARREASEKLRRIVVDALLRCADGLLEEGEGKRAARIYRDLSAAGEEKHVRAAALRGLKAAGRE